MKIAHISDLHLDINQGVESDDIIYTFISVMKKKEYDILLLSGDISSYHLETLFVLDRIKEETGKPVYFVPGNHDLKTEYGELTDDIYKQYLKHESVLIGKPLVIENRFAIVGGLGWYDYTYGPIGQDNEAFEEMKQIYWWDGTNINWKHDDEQVTINGIESLRQDLDKVKHLPTWVMTHFVPYAKYITYGSPVWNITNAFIGSERVGELIDQYENVKYVSFGHTHRRYGKVKHDGRKEVIVNPIGYIEEWTSDRFKKEVDDNLIIVEI